MLLVHLSERTAETPIWLVELLGCLQAWEVTVAVLLVRTKQLLVKVAAFREMVEVLAVTVSPSTMLQEAAAELLVIPAMVGLDKTSRRLAEV